MNVNIKTVKTEKGVVSAKNNFEEIVVKIDSEELTTIRYNPHNPRFYGYVGRILEVVNSPAFKRIKPENIEYDGSDESTDALVKTLTDFDSAIDELERVTDKILGDGKTHIILDNDNERLELFFAVMSPVFKIYRKEEDKKADKYRTKKPITKQITEYTAEETAALVDDVTKAGDD